MQRNIGTGGRLLRASLSLGCAAGAFFVWPHSKAASAGLAAAALFTGFEALRGWCAVRACGIRTPL